MTHLDDLLEAQRSQVAVDPERYTFQMVLEAKSLGCLESLNEASLGRVFQHIKNAGEKSWAIITSWRAGIPKRENMSRMQKLKQGVRSLGLGFFGLKGHWRECQNPNIEYKECPSDKLIDSVEPSLWINGITKAQAKKMMTRYEQDAIVFSGPETKGKVSLMFRKGAPMNIGKFHPGAIAQAYSQVKGRPFKFEAFEYPAQSHAEALIEQSYHPWDD
jgi:hypothetical protein